MTTLNTHIAQLTPADKLRFAGSLRALAEAYDEYALRVAERAIEELKMRGGMLSEER